MSNAAQPALDGRPSVIARAVSYLRRNEILQAQSLLSQALVRSPEDPAFLHLMGAVRRLENKSEEAEELYRRSLAHAAAQPHVHRDLGKLLASRERLDEAVAEFREALRLKQDDADAHLCLAAVRARQGDHGDAVAGYREALRFQPGHAAARLGLADALCHLGRAREAELLLRQAPQATEPALAAAFAYRMGIALRLQKKYQQALTMFAAALKHQPDNPSLHFVRGETYQQMGLWDEAAQAFRDVLARAPEHTNAGACLALIAALHGGFAEAHKCAANVLARAPAHEIAHIALALAEIEDGAYAAAADRLRRILESPAAKSEGTAVAAGFAADAFDRRGRYGESFAVSRASKAMLRRAWAVEPGLPPMTDVAQRMTNYFKTSDRWRAATETQSDGRPAGHLFVLGFLRSGTTLIETILAGAGNVAHAHEIDFLADAAQAFLGNSQNLDRLRALSDPDADAWREKYWRSVREAQLRTSGMIFVDKMPINTFRLPLIARLFPSAKIVFAIRDPRDVVLSCFRRHFDRTAYSVEFAGLEDCARFYAAAMALADACRAKLPLEILDLRYEEVVGDFDATVGGLCGFAGIDWSPSLRDFHAAAETIDLRSASARQVRRGLYSDAVGHWRNYREELAPVLPILAPWAARFGYPVE